MTVTEARGPMSIVRPDRLSGDRYETSGSCRKDQRAIDMGQAEGNPCRTHRDEHIGAVSIAPVHRDGGNSRILRPVKCAAAGASTSVALVDAGSTVPGDIFPIVDIIW